MWQQHPVLAYNHNSQILLKNQTNHEIATLLPVLSWKPWVLSGFRITCNWQFFDSDILFSNNQKVQRFSDFEAIKKLGIGGSLKIQIPAQHWFNPITTTR